MNSMREEGVSASIEIKSIPTYLPKAAMKLPIFYEKRQYQGASGRIYPLAATDSFSDTIEDKEWTVGILENEYIYLELLPEIGGKIKRAFDKKHSYDFVYHNSIIKPAGIGIAGPWISGGIEFNWPQHHRPTTFMPVEAAVEENPDGSKTIWVGETEPLYRTKGMAGITVAPGRTYIRSKVKIYNDTALAQPFMWWSNLAAPATDGYRIVFPEDVEYVMDHDRRAVMSWPVASGRYGTGRGYDFGEATDISRYINIEPQSSYMVPFGQSEMDYISGYDEDKGLGIVSVSDHNVAPAKKLFTWGISDFADMWCMNLTDSDGPYIEIMTGAYTDNQPDFSWIAPYETKEFEQYWYPVFDIGLVKNATKDAALNLEVRDDGLFLGINVTGRFDDAVVEVSSSGNVIFSEKVTLTPDSAYIKQIENVAYSRENLSARVTDSDGNTLVHYSVFKRGDKKRPDARTAARKPEEIKTVDELYINGLHLVQYRHHSFVPEDYFLEGLKRDPGDIRCNIAMGKQMLYKGQLDKAIEYFNKAIERLTSRNETPYDTEVYYYLGIALSACGEKNRAYDALYRCVWSYPYRSGGYFALAVIDSFRKDYKKALYHLNLSGETNSGNNKALILKSRLLALTGSRNEAESILVNLINRDLLSVHAKCEIYLLGFDTELEGELGRLLALKPDYATGLAEYYISCGFIDEAKKILGFAVGSPLALYYTAYCSYMQGNKVAAEEYILQAEQADYSYCFPCRLFDADVLELVLTVYPDAYMAAYYLGCLYTGNEQFDRAISMYEYSRRINPRFSHTMRNLAHLYFNKAHSFANAKALMEYAVGIDDDPRLFYEYQQLLKNMGYSVDYRLAEYDEYAGRAEQRDDNYIEYLTLLGMKGSYSDVIRLAKDRQFHVYEGGEGKLSRLYIWMNLLEGCRYMEAGDTAGALKYFYGAIDLPKNFAEARSVFDDTSHIYYYIASAYEADDNIEEAAKYHQLIKDTSYVISETSFWKALSLMKSGYGAESAELLHAMYSEGETLLANKNDYPYFGGGSPTPQPFEEDIARKNTIAALILQMFACYGLGDYTEAGEKATVLEEMDPANLSLYIFKTLMMEM